MPAPMRCVVLSLLLAGALPASAARADTPSYAAALSQMEGAAAAGLAPVTLSSPRDVYVAVRMGGSYAEITVLGQGDAAAAGYSVSLERAMRGSPMAARKPEWGFDDDWAAAVLSGRSPAPGRRSASMAVPVGRLLEELRIFRLRPHAVLFVPPDAVVSPSLPSTPVTGWRAIALDGLRPTATVKVVRRVSDTTIALLAAMWGLALGAAVWCASARRGVREGLPPRSGAPWPLVGLLAAQAALLVAAIGSASAAQVGDVWLGTGAPWAGAALFGAALVLSGALGLDAVRTARGKPAPRAMTAEETVRAQRDAWRTAARVAGVGLVGLAYLLNSDLKGYARLVDSFGVAALIFLVDLAFRKRIAPFERREPDAGLTSLAQRLAAGTGVLVTAVLIDDTDKGREGSSVSMRQNALVMPRALVNTLTVEEAEFVLARAIVHQAMQRDSEETLRLLAPLAAAVLLMIALALRRGAPTWMVGVGALVTVGALALALAVTLSHSKVRRETQEDARAVELTRNLPAALSAVEKTFKASTKGQTVIFSGLKGRKKRLLAAARAAGLSALIALACALPARAEGPSTSSIDRAADLAIEQGLLPPTLKGKRDVYLIVRAGAAYAHVAALARPSVSPARLAGCLESAVRGTALAGTRVDTDPDPLYTAAILSYGHRAIGRNTSSTQVPLGALVESLRRAGFVPHACLRVPAYATSDAPPSWARDANPRFRYYVVKPAPPAATVTVRAALPARALAMVLALFCVPFAAVIAFTWMTVRRKRAGNDGGSRLDRWLPMGVIFLALPVQAMCLLTAARSGALSAVSDLWLGSLRSTSLMLICLAPALLLMLPMMFLQHRAMDPAAALAARVELSPEEKALRQTMDRWKIAVKLLMWVAFIAYLALGRGKGPHGSFEFVAAALATVLVDLAFRKRLAPFEGKSADDALARRAQSLAAGTGVTVTEVVVDEGLAGRAVITATLVKGRLAVSRRAVDTLTPEELDFTLARAVVKPDVSVTGAQGISGMVVGLAMIGGMAYFMHAYRRTLFEHIPVAMAVCLGGCLALGVWVHFQGGRGVAVLDRRALALTRDAEAAISAIEKGLYSAEAAALGQAKSGTNPVSPKRIKALRAAAYDLGLSVPEDAVKVRL